MRLRFAPSPTGALHIGGARTALYNWLLARGGGGTLVLRIEDTDHERSTQENVDQILEALEWLGIDYDEGPISQAARVDRHKEVIEQLLEEGKAYRSTATSEDVKAYKAEHGADKGFRGTPEPEGAIRLEVPDGGRTEFDDVVRGPISFGNVHLDDPVIARADGTPLYNFAVAIDDSDAGITHVVRGEDHISNTPKQLLVLNALGIEPPRYAHLPLLHGPDGKKLSKRHGAASVQELRDKGYLPEAVRNYVALLGAGYDDREEFFTTEELQRRFALERVSKSAAVFDEQKLRHMNGRYLRALPAEELARRLERRTGRTGLLPYVEIAQEKISTLDEFESLCGFFFDGPADDPKAREKILGSDEARRRLAKARERLSQVDEPWATEGIQPVLDELADELAVKRKDLFQPIRVALAGTTISPGIYETVALLGKPETLRRMDAALNGHG